MQSNHNNKFIIYQWYRTVSLCSAAIVLSFNPHHHHHNPLYCTWLTISLARASDSTICWHSFLRRTV